MLFKDMQLMTRVRTLRAIDLHPHATINAGKRGTLVDRNGATCMVRMDTDAEAVAYDADMARLFDLPGDPYAVALEAMRKAGLNVY